MSIPKIKNAPFWRLIRSLFLGATTGTYYFETASSVAPLSLQSSIRYHPQDLFLKNNPKNYLRFFHHILQVQKTISPLFVSDAVVIR